MNAQSPQQHPQAGPPSYASPQPYAGPGGGMPPHPDQPGPKRSWFARHKFLTAIGAVLAVGVIGAALNPGGDDDPSAGTDTTAAEQTTAAADEAQEADEQEAPAADVDEQEAPAGPGIGDAARDGDFEFVVSEIEPGVEKIGGEYLSTTAQGQFVLVRLDVTNIGTSAQTLFDSNQMLVDDEGREHSADTSAGIYLDDNEVWITEINPGNTLSGTLVFDIPADATPDHLVLHDSMFSGGVEVAVR